MTGRPRVPLAVGSLALAASLTAACGRERVRRAGADHHRDPRPRRRPPARRPRQEPRPRRHVLGHGSTNDVPPRARAPRPGRLVPRSPPPCRRSLEPAPSRRCASHRTTRRWARAPTPRSPRSQTRSGAGWWGTRGPRVRPVGRTGLRYVTVNFWGFDGKRSRGALVVNRSVAPQVAAAFTRLYEQRFRIRQMRPMDSSWGRNPKGPGANDYAAMEADNTRPSTAATSAARRSGRSTRGTPTVWPSTSTTSRTRTSPPTARSTPTTTGPTAGPAPGVFSSSSSAAVRAFTSQGMRWGGLWANPDYQHFDAS